MKHAIEIFPHIKNIKCNHIAQELYKNFKNVNQLWILNQNNSKAHFKDSLHLPKDQSQKQERTIHL